MRVTDAVAILDAGGVIVAWNTCAEHLFGWKRDEAVGKTLSPVLGLTGNSANRKEDAGAQQFEFHSLVDHRVDLDVHDKDGNPLSIETSVTRFELQGQVCYCACMRNSIDCKANEEVLFMLFPNAANTTE